MDKNKRKKLIIIGVDGGTFDVINPLIDEGKLLNFGNFRYKNVLTSTTPPGTAVSWASFLTGNSPNKTNIYDFTIVEDNSWKIKVINKSLLRTKPLWRYLNENNVRGFFANIPLTYPPEEINGVIISGIDTPSTLSNYVYPKELKEKLNKFDYEIEVSGIKEPNEISEQALKIAKKRALVFNYLLKKEFDFFVMLFRETDVIQHFSWGSEKIEQVYKIVDDFIGNVKEMAKKNKWDVIIVSDHGHEKVSKAFNINAWLESEGYLKTFNKKSRKLSSIINRERIFRFLDKFKLNFLVKIVPRNLGKKIPTKNLGFEEAILTNLIDFNSTKAVAKRAVKTAQIFLNTESRGGFIKSSEEKNLSQEIKNKLIKYFKDKKLETEIKTKEELYGKKTKYAPDITLYFKEKGFDILSKFSSKMKIWDETKEGATHNKEGIILSDIKLNSKNPKMIDLTPTILKYFGIKGDNFDGKSLI